MIDQPQVTKAVLVIETNDGSVVNIEFNNVSFASRIIEMLQNSNALNLKSAKVELIF